MTDSSRARILGRLRAGQRTPLGAQIGELVNGNSHPQISQMTQIILPRMARPELESE